MKTVQPDFQDTRSRLDANPAAGAQGALGPIDDDVQLLHQLGYKQVGHTSLLARTPAGVSLTRYRRSFVESSTNGQQFHMPSRFLAC